MRYRRNCPETGPGQGISDTISRILSLIFGILGIEDRTTFGDATEKTPPKSPGRSSRAGGGRGPGVLPDPPLADYSMDCHGVSCAV